MRITQDVLSLALVASSVLGVQILLFDRWLWSAAPSHAYGLVGFVALDALLTLAVWKGRTNLVSLSTMIVSSIQSGAMLADLILGQPNGIPSIVFRNYLLSDASYVGLLLIQLVILVVAIYVLTSPLVHTHSRWKAILLLRG